MKCKPMRRSIGPFRLQDFVHQRLLSGVACKEQASSPQFANICQTSRLRHFNGQICSKVLLHGFYAVLVMTHDFL